MTIRDVYNKNKEFTAQSDKAWDDWVNQGVKEAQSRLIYFKYYSNPTEEGFKEWYKTLVDE